MIGIWKDKRLRNLRIASFMAILSVLLGTVVYYLLGFSIIESFYMTIITLSTVGYGEVHELSVAGKLFTSVYIILNITLFAYIVSIFTRYFFEGELKEIYKKYMTNLDVKKLDNHVIVCGYGRNGSKASEELFKNNIPFVVIDKDVDVLKHKLAGQDDIIYLEGEATDDDILKEAGISKAQSIITTLPKDADNVFVTLTARGLNPKINIIARASEQSSEKKLLRAGANSVVMPDAIGGLHMAQLITKPDVIQFIDMLSGIGDVKLTLDEIMFSEMKDVFKNKTIRELDIRNKTGATIIGYKHANDGFIINPSPDLKIQDGDVLIILGREEEINNCREMCCA